VSGSVSFPDTSGHGRTVPERSDGGAAPDRKAGTTRADKPRMDLLHLAARMDFGSPPLIDERACDLWTWLRQCFPSALAATLMPDHLHVITPGEPEAGRATLQGILAQHRGMHGSPGRGRGPGRWTIPPPSVIPDVRHLGRQVRYVSLNPCRAGLVRDPLAWLWSTHRDVVGAVVDPWVTADRLAEALGERARGFVERHHAYVSGDPSAAVSGTPLPRVVAVHPGSPEILAAAAALACRHLSERDLPRRRGAARVFHGLARALRIPRRAALRVTGAADSTAYRWAATLPDADLQAALLCLSDARLRRPGDLGRIPSLRVPPSPRRFRPRREEPLIPARSSRCFARIREVVLNDRRSAEGG